MLALSIVAAVACAQVPPPTDRLPSAAATRTLARVTAALEDVHLNDHVLAAEFGGPPARFGGRADPRKARLKVVTDGLAQLLTELGDAAVVDVAKGEGSSLAAKLVAIALDRRDHPGAYEALDQVYGSENGIGQAGGNATVAGPRMVRIRKEHIRPQYRLAWEYRLLVFPALDEVTGREPDPEGPGVEALPGGPVTLPPTFEGVRRTGTDATVSTVTFAFRHACTDDERGRDDSQLRWFCWAILESHVTPTALRAILDCAEFAERQWAKQKPTTPGPRGTDPAVWVARLADAPTAEGREKWRVAAAAVAAGPLTARQREMLAGLQKRLPAR